MAKKTENSPKETALILIEGYRKEGAHLLIPEMRFEGLSPYHAPVVESVTASLNPADGDIYPHDKRSWRLAAKFLQKLSICAGIRWDSTETKRTDNRADRDYVSYQAAGNIVKPDGSVVGFKGEYDLDMDIIREEITDSYAMKAKDWENKQEWFQKMKPDQKTDYVQRCINRDVLQKRKNKLKLAETGAKNRAIRSLLGLKNFYTTEELKKPFVMVRIVVSPDYEDPEVRKAMLAATVQAITGIYHEPEPAIDADYTAEMQPSGTWPEPTEPATPPPAAPANTNTPPTPEGPPDPQLIDFQNADPESRVCAIKALAERKKYDLSALPMPIAGMQPHPQERLFKTLLSRPLPTAEPEPVADGIPS